MGNSHGKAVVLGDEVNLNHFRLLRVVGKGAFGKVRIVERKDSGLTFALKYIRKDEIVRSESVRNIIRERRMMEHLNHPFLCNLRKSGTLAYLAPEVFMGRGYLSEVDWWSAGVTFYECIYGKRPFDGRSQDELAESVIAAKPKYYVTRPPVSMPCLNAMQCLMEKDRRKRIGAIGFETFTNHPFFQEIDFVALEQKQIRPVFVPSSEKTNFDATYDLEELLLEEAPLEARARKQKPRAELRDDATSREIREDELHRMIERMFEPFDYTRASYDVQAAEAVQAVAKQAPPEFLEQTMVQSQNHSSPTSPAASPPLAPATEIVEKPNDTVPPLDETHNIVQQPQPHVITRHASNSKSFSRPIPPQRPQAAVRQVSKGGGVQMVLDEGSSWSNLADQSAVVLPTDVGAAEVIQKSDKSGSMLGFLSRKGRRERSPKPSEPGVLGKIGARHVIS
ncbi:hypothetical protein DV738_g1348, partial [Chaetothyriales sp. CBS 135597]